jgi:pimeloyl-ACP methyl ester carboxylesterase
MQTHHFEASDGVRLAYHSLGEGRPALLLHGFLSSARRNWFAPGLAQALADAGLRVVAPDARGHGASDAPTDLAAWPADIMARDVLDLIAHLDLKDFDLAGYSMGARTAIRACARGLRPRRLVTGGMGESGVMEAGPRADLFEDAIRHGERAADPAMGAALWKLMTAQGLSPDAMLGVLASFHPTTEAEIRALDIPALVILGQDDQDNGSAETLAAWLPRGHCVRTPGDHGTTVSTPEFRDAMTGFLTLVVRTTG